MSFSSFQEDIVVESVETDLETVLKYMFQVVGFRICSLQELLRLAPYRWRLKNPVSQSSVSQIRLFCHSHAQRYVLMELGMCELVPVVNGRLNVN